MIDFNKCRVSPAGNIITPKARLSFPVLFTAKKFNEAEEKAKFGASFLIPPGADLTLLKQAAEKAAKEKWGDTPPKGLKNPFLKAGDFESSSDFEGWTLIRATAITKPGLVDARGENVSEESETYPGRWCVASLRAFTWERKTGKGVSFGLQNIQLLDHDEPLGGRARAESEFEPVDVPAAADGKKESADSVFS
jgi:hypothetical protein